jgi:hypothetical protein
MGLRNSAAPGAFALGKRHAIFHFAKASAATSNLESKSSLMLGLKNDRCQIHTFGMGKSNSFSKL